MTKKQKNELSKHSLVAVSNEYIKEAKDYAQEFQDRVKVSWDMIHGKINWSHKKDDNSKIHINRVGIAHEQAKANFKQALMNFEKWLVCEPSTAFVDDNEVISRDVAKRMVIRALEKTNVKAKITDNIGIGLVENLMATKITPHIVERNTANGKIKEFHVKHEILDINTYYKDPYSPDGCALYEFQESMIDKHVLLASAGKKQSTKTPYLKHEVEKLSIGVETDELLEQEENRGTQVHLPATRRRHRVLIHEMWGTFLDENGLPMKYTKEDGNEIELKDVVFTIANNECIISEPVKFPTYDGESYFLSMQLLRSNVNLYGRSILEPGVDMNQAENEIFNAALDAGLKEAYNATIAHYSGFLDKSQLEGGIKPGVTYWRNDAIPIGAPLIESLPTGKIPPALLNLMGVIKQTGTENVLSNVPAQGGVVNKQVKATELSIANQSIGGLIESLASDIEDIYIENYAKKVFNLVLQHKQHLTDDDLVYIFDGNKERITQFKEVSPKECFKAYGGFFKFRGKGIRSVAANMRQAQTLVQVMSMIVANPLMAQSFERQGYDVTKMIDEVLQNMGLDTENYKNPQLAEFAQQREMVKEEALAGRGVEGPGPVEGGGPSPAGGMEPGSGAGV